jgi:preprotein translocase subunit SecA
MGPPASALDRLFAQVGYLVHNLCFPKLPDARSLARDVERQQAGDAASASAGLAGLRYRLRRDGFTDELLAECFSLPRAAVDAEALSAARQLLRGGIVALDDPQARRQALALAALARALAGERVHLVTATDAAAKALAASLEPIFAPIGVAVASLGRESPAAQRRELHAAPVLCASYREIALDYLHDSVRRGERRGPLRARLERLTHDLRLGELQCALVEDATRVLLDSAQAPIALTAASDASRERLMYEQALELARTFSAQADYTVDEGAIRLTAPASERLERLTAPLGGIWAARGRREELVGWALEALHFLERGTDYRVEQGRVLFPPPAEGEEEPAADELEVRKLVEVKEGCRLSSRPDVLARL